MKQRLTIIVILYSVQNNVKDQFSENVALKTVLLFITSLFLYSTEHCRTKMSISTDETTPVSSVYDTESDDETVTVSDTESDDEPELKRQISIAFPSFKLDNQNDQNVFINTIMSSFDESEREKKDEHKEIRRSNGLAMLTLLFSETNTPGYYEFPVNSVRRAYMKLLRQVHTKRKILAYMKLLRQVHTKRKILARFSVFFTLVKIVHTGINKLCAEYAIEDFGDNLLQIVQRTTKIVITDLLKEQEDADAEAKEDADAEAKEDADAEAKEDADAENEDAEDEEEEGESMTDILREFSDLIENWFENLSELVKFEQQLIDFVAVQHGIDYSYIMNAAGLSKSICQPDTCSGKSGKCSAENTASTLIRSRNNLQKKIAYRTMKYDQHMQIVTSRFHTQKVRIQKEMLDLKQSDTTLAAEMSKVMKANTNWNLSGTDTGRKQLDILFLMIVGTLAHAGKDVSVAATLGIDNGSIPFIGALGYYIHSLLTQESTNRKTLKKISMLVQRMNNMREILEASIQHRNIFRGTHKKDTYCSLSHIRSLERQVALFFMDISAKMLKRKNTFNLKDVHSDIIDGIENEVEWIRGQVDNELAAAALARPFQYTPICISAFEMYDAESSMNVIREFSDLRYREEVDTVLLDRLTKTYTRITNKDENVTMPLFMLPICASWTDSEKCVKIGYVKEDVQNAIETVRRYDTAISIFEKNRVLNERSNKPFVEDQAHYTQQIETEKDQKRAALTKLGLHPGPDFVGDALHTCSGKDYEGEDCIEYIEKYFRTCSGDKDENCLDYAQYIDRALVLQEFPEVEKTKALLHVKHFIRGAMNRLNKLIVDSALERVNYEIAPTERGVQSTVDLGDRVVMVEDEILQKKPLNATIDDLYKTIDGHVIWPDKNTFVNLYKYHMNILRSMRSTEDKISKKSSAGKFIDIKYEIFRFWPQLEKESNPVIEDELESETEDEDLRRVMVSFKSKGPSKEMGDLPKLFYLPSHPHGFEVLKAVLRDTVACVRNNQCTHNILANDEIDRVRTFNLDAARMKTMHNNAKYVRQLGVKNFK